jgi:hypothetical protein
MTEPIGIEPGPTEYGWGKGIQNPVDIGDAMSPYEKMRSERATNPADASAVADPVEQGYIREDPPAEIF